MPLDPVAEKFLREINESDTPPLDLSCAGAARISYQKQLDSREKIEKVPVNNVLDITIEATHGDIPIRVYTPDGNPPFPILVYFHGGGWVLGNLESHDDVCRFITKKAGCLTFSVDYRLAPEHKFPVPLDDCYNATTWISQHGSLYGGDTNRISVGGDSAGGNLAAACTLKAGDQGYPKIVFQLLVYPVTDNNFSTTSYTQLAEGYLLTRPEMKWFWKQYLSEKNDGEHRYASVLQAENIRNPPPALIITAEYDPLRDEGEAYGQLLKKAGGKVKILRYSGMIHGFFNNPIFHQRREAQNEAAKAIQDSDS